MDELQELLAQLERLDELSNEELDALLADLRAASETVLAGDVDDAALASLEAVAEATERIEATIAQREEAAAEQAQRAQALRERIQGEGEVEPDPEETPEEEPEAEAEVETPEPEEPEEPEAPEEPQAVAASTATPASITRVSARRPAALRPRPSVRTPEPVITASANLPGIPAGRRLDSPEQLSAAFDAAYQTTKGYAGGRQHVNVGRIEARYPAERTLGRDPVLNAQKIEAVTGLEGIQAAGGICAPPTVRYDLPTVGVEARPFRDGALARFGVDGNGRGAVTTLGIPLLTDVGGSVGVWTETTDQAPGQDTKDCLTITCPGEATSTVDAITKCLRYGNFMGRFFPENIAAFTRLAGVWHARTAESRAITTVGTGSTAVTTGEVLGTTRDVLAAVDRAAASMRNRHRMDPAMPLRFAAPAWLKDNIRTDLARELPGSTDERLATADAKIMTFFAVRNINVTWFLDGETGEGQVFGAQGDGALVGWPTAVVTYLYPEGTWLFLDGGSLDFGLVRDSTLNETNEVVVFMETFEAVHFHGVESLKLTLNICPDGSTSATKDIDPCLLGS